MFPFRGFSRRPAVFAAAAFATFAVAIPASPAPSSAQGRRTAARAVSARSEAQDMGTVRAQARAVHPIAIARFRPAPGSAASLPEGFFQNIIHTDLRVTGLFRPSADVAQTEAAHAAWLAKTSDFTPWRSLGARFFCSASYVVGADGALGADVRVYDSESGARVFGRRYRKGFSASRPERLAHRVADDILLHIAQEEGLSSTYIAFVSSRGRGVKELFVMSAAGTDASQLTQDGSLVAAPCWGARGGEIYFTSYKRYNPDLVGVTLDGQRRWTISSRPGNNVSPAWCERRGLMAATLGKDGNQEIYAMDRSGGALTRLTRGKAIDSSPTWSPDGNKLAFVSNRAGGPQVYVMDADGGNTRRASFVSNYSTSPAWSPDGEKLAFSAQVRGRHEIVVLDLRSNQARQITRGPGDSEDPAWAPSGDYLAFSNNRSGQYQIYRMRADGSNLVQLTAQGENTSPAWGPLPGSSE